MEDVEDDAPVIYGLEFQARAMTAQFGEAETIQFLVGTQSLRFENQIHQIDFDEENNFINKNVFNHLEGEIWHISASPQDSQLMATVYNKTSDYKTEMKGSIWRIPDAPESKTNGENTSLQALDLVCHLDKDDDNADMKSVLWHPSGESSSIITLSGSHIKCWDLQEGDAKNTSCANLDSKGQPKFTCARWNPHHSCSQIATANDSCIRGWDLRSMQQVYSIENAHGQLVRDLDFNPNKQYYLASCGDDCKAKFWDIRKGTQPVTVLTDHSHWIWKVRYNQFHDQLILTSSSDSQVILTNAASISSEPFGNLVDEEDGDDIDQRERNKEALSDGVIAVYEEHEDSVYAVEWAAADPWLFASLSYDGRLVINRVPRATKYKILL